VAFFVALRREPFGRPRLSSRRTPTDATRTRSGDTRWRFGVGRDSVTYQSNWKTLWAAISICGPTIVNSCFPCLSFYLRHMLTSSSSKVMFIFPSCLIFKTLTSMTAKSLTKMKG